MPRDPHDPDHPADFEIPVEDAAPAGVNPDVARLAAMTPFEYEQVREEEAKLLKVRASVLDKEVDAARKAQADDDDDGVVESLEPWPEPVDGSVLDEIRADFERHVIADAASKDALAVWALGTYVYDAFPIFPKAFLSSPERRCGKSVTLEVLEANVHRALVASSISPSSIFRGVELWRPSLLIDEADRLPKDNEELTGIINAGHRKRTAFVIRNVKVNDEHEPRKFSTWAPMALAAIGRMADTIMDRSVVIHLRRKAPGEQVQKIPMDLFERNHSRRRRCLRWAEDAAEQLRNTQVQLPQHGNDRMLDNWLPLFAIAEAVGGEWPGRVRAAFDRLSIEEEEEAVGPMLLADIKEIFEARRLDKLFSRDLVAGLTEMEGRPWAEWRRGRPLTQNSLAKLLEPYKIRPETVRLGADRAKGYKRSRFQDAWLRYLSPAEPPVQTVTPCQPSNGAGSSEFETVTDSENVTGRNSREPSNDAACHDVTDQNGASGERTHRRVRI